MRRTSVRRRARAVPGQRPPVRRQGGRARTTTSGSAAGIVDRDAVRRRPAANGFLGMAVPEEYGGGGVDDFRYNLVIGEEVQRGGRRRRRARPHAAQRHLPALLPVAVHRRAEGAVAAGHLLGRADHRHRHDRAGHRLRPGVDDHDRRPRRRRLRRQRVEDVHHQRHQRRPRHHRGEDRPDAAPPGHVAARARAGHGRASSGAATSRRSACTPRTPPSCSSPTCGCRWPTCSARRARASATWSRNLPQERLSIAAAGVAAARAGARLDARLRARSARRSASRSARSRTAASGWPRWRTEIEIGQAFVDRCVVALNAGELTAEEAADGQVVVHRAAGRVVDRCVQLHGGYGYMTEYPIARAYADARITTHLRRHDRDHEGDHRPLPRRVTPG